MITAREAAMAVAEAKAAPRWVCAVDIASIRTMTNMVSAAGATVVVVICKKMRGALRPAF